MAELQHTFVTELYPASGISAADYVLISQKGTGSNYISRKLQYSVLCADILADADNRISAFTSAAISAIEVSALTNARQISAVSASLAETTSAVIKIANCVQKNKVDISAISSDVRPISQMVLSGYNGISASRVGGTYKWNIGHTGSITAAQNRFSKFSYNSSGHITADNAVASSDIIKLGSFVVSASNGISCASHGIGLKPAANTELGGVKVNGNNLKMLADGVLSAKDTTYSAGNGLNKSALNQFSLVYATSSQLGGVKVGANLNIGADGVLSAQDTTYTAGTGIGISGGKISLSAAKPNVLGGVKVGANLSIGADGTLCAAYIGPATEISAGVIQLGYKATAATPRNYAVSASGGKAYVNVPWTDSAASLRTGEYHISNKYSIISAISYSKGNITGISSSTELYNLISAVSAETSAARNISSCIMTNNGRLDYDDKTGLLELYKGSTPLSSGGTYIPAIVAGEIVTSAYAYDHEGQQTVSSGLYVKLTKNTAVQSADNIYIDVKQLKDTVVESAYYNHNTKNIIMTFNDKARSNISVHVGDLVDTYTAGNGLNLAGNQFSVKYGKNLGLSGAYLTAQDTTYTAGNGLSLDGNQFIIPKYETWHFTLDNGETADYTVALI